MAKIGEILIGGRVATSGLDAGFSKTGKVISDFNGVANNKLAAVNATLGKGATAFRNFYGAATGKASAVISPLLKIASVTGLVATALETISLSNTFSRVDEITNTARGIGVAAGALAELRYVATQTGTAAGDMDAALTHLGPAIANAAVEAGPTSRAIKALGLDITSLSAVSPDQAFRSIADRLSEVKDRAQRARLTLDIFGESGRKLLPTLSAGTAKMAALSAEAKRLGVSVSEVDQTKLVAAQAAISKIGAAIQGIGNTVAIYVAPYIETMADKFTAFVGGASGGARIVEGAIRGIGKGIGFIVDAVWSIGRAWKSVVATIEEGIGKILQSIGKGGADLIADAASIRAKLDAELAAGSPGSRLTAGLDAYLLKIKAITAATAVAATAQAKWAGASGLSARELRSDAESASKIIESIQTPLQNLQKELMPINTAFAKGLLTLRQFKMAKQNAVAKLNQAPRFAAAQEFGSAEARTTVLQNTSGYVENNGIPKLVGFAGEQLGVQNRILAALMGQNALAAQNRGNVEFSL